MMEGRSAVKESDRASLAVGTTTLEDVLLRLGEPDLVLPAYRVMAYRWRVIQGYLFIAVPVAAGAGGGGPLIRENVLMLEFDPQGRLVRFKRADSLRSTPEMMLDDWLPTDDQPFRSFRGARPPCELAILIAPMPPAPARASAAGTTTNPVRFQVGEFRYRQTDRSGKPEPDNAKLIIGTIPANRWLGRPSADIWMNRPPDEVIRALVVAHLEAAGHRLVFRNPDVTVTGEITEFGLTAAISNQSWQVSGSLDVTLKARRGKNSHAEVLRRYQARHASSFTSVMLSSPGPYLLDSLMRECLEEMLAQMAADAELTKPFDAQLREQPVLL